MTVEYVDSRYFLFYLTNFGSRESRLNCRPLVKTDGPTLKTYEKAGFSGFMKV
jgi:hypothetical protein